MHGALYNQSYPSSFWTEIIFHSTWPSISRIMLPWYAQQTASLHSRFVARLPLALSFHVANALRPRMFGGLKHNVPWFASPRVLLVVANLFIASKRIWYRAKAKFSDGKRYRDETLSVWHLRDPSALKGRQPGAVSLILASQDRQGRCTAHNEGRCFSWSHLLVLVIVNSHRTKLTML